MHRLGKVLDGLFALVDELDFEFVADLVTHYRRTGNAAGLRQRFEPGRQVDAIAVEIVAIDDDVADIDADAEFDLAIIRDSRISIMHAGLNLDSTARGVQHAAELDEQAVAHHLEDAAPVFRYGRIEELAAMLPESAERAFLIGLHKSAVAHDIDRHNGRQPPLDLLLGQFKSPNLREQMYAIQKSIGKPADIRPEKEFVNACLPKAGQQSKSVEAGGGLAASEGRLHVQW